MDKAEELYKKFEKDYNSQKDILELKDQLNKIHERIFGNGNKNN